MNKKLLVLLASLFLGFSVSYAEVPSKERMYQIMDDINATYDVFEDLSFTLTLISEQPNKPKEAQQFKLFRRNSKDQTTLVQLAPEKDKGTGYLQEKNNLWTYNPISHQFNHSSIKVNLGDSDAKISDVKKKSEFRVNWQIDKIEEAKLGKYKVYAVSATALTKDETYPKEKYFVRQDKNLILKIENYGASGKLMRTILIPKYVQLKGVPFPVHQIYLNNLIKGKKTTQIFSDFDLSKIPDMVFTKAYLEKIN